MRVIRTETEIETSPAAVWAVLTDFAAYPEWNPFITEASGTLAVGETLTLHMVPGEGKAQTFTPEVRAVRENTELVWLGALRWSWLFSAEHRFTLSEVGGGTRLVHSEVFRGALVPLLRAMIDQKERDFRTMNAALKDRVEPG
ncbi:SRPBCC family protein [Actinophytocola glycyrrhizae]|uniref:SRPBCC family protein n=1 Tax=Actinophytocola glycyrrhizae TaxID=2044873 RepID=A0ABV9SC86_9PSEU